METLSVSVEKVVTEFTEGKNLVHFNVKFSVWNSIIGSFWCIAALSVHYGNPPRLGYLKKNGILCCVQTLAGFPSQCCYLGAELQHYYFNSFKEKCYLWCR